MSKGEICKLIDEAFNWSSDKKGSGLALYSFASTRTVHSEEHRANLFREIASNVDYVATQKTSKRPRHGELTPAGQSRQIKLLGKLAGFIAEAELGVEFVTDEQMMYFWDNKLERRFS